MALINHAKREINAKIVYYGCEGSGKRTSLQYIYDRIKPSLRGELKTLPTSGGKLLFFDFSPFETPLFGGYRIRFHIYTLPGRVVNPAAWKMTLKGADGLVIVADGTPERSSAGRDSTLMLRDFLSAYGLSLHDIPTVLQRNSFSSDVNMPPDEFATALDLAGIPTRHSEAISGEGVLETLTTLSRAIINRIGQDSALRAGDAEAEPKENSSVEAVVNNQAQESAGYDVPEVQDECRDGLWEQAIERQESKDKLLVMLAGDGAACHEGVVRIPLELTLDGASRRLVVSVSLTLDTPTPQ